MGVLVLPLSLRVPLQQVSRVSERHAANFMDEVIYCQRHACLQGFCRFSGASTTPFRISGPGKWTYSSADLTLLCIDLASIKS